MKRQLLSSRVPSSVAGFTLVCLLVLISSALLLPGPVQAQPVITTSPLLPQGQVNAEYYAVLQASNCTGTCNWTYSGALPPGLTLAPTGIISGKPTMAGTFNFTATVTDSVGPASQPFIITIVQPPLKFLTYDLVAAKEHESYVQTIRVSGGKTPYVWSISSGALPSGLVLNSSNGFISGTPAKDTEGYYSFTVSVTDDSSPIPLSGQQSYTITVEKGGYEATITIGAGLKAGETKVLVDGSEQAKLQGGGTMTLSLDLGVSRYIGVDALVPHPTESGIRFKAEVDRLTVSEASPDANFPYYTEYSVELKADPSKVGQLTGSGWYKEGYTLRVTATDQVDDPDQPGTQYRFLQWVLPTGETVSGRDLSLTVNAPGVCTAKYDTYYKLTLTSPYGEAEGSNWYKARSQAEWDMTNPQIRMPGILGIFGGKLNAVNYSGTTVMDSPKTVEIVWQPDYTMPLIFIPLAIILLILGGYGLYLLLRSLQPKPVPSVPYPPPYYQPMPPPQQPPIIPPPTVVMIGGERPRLGPPTTREQLMEKFGELLERYEEEIKGTPSTRVLPGVKTVGEDKRLQAPGPVPPTTAEAEGTPEEESKTCSFAAKKPLRVVASSWKQAETRTVDLPPPDEETAEGEAGLAIVWTRDIYQEWEIMNCWLQRGHEEAHEGSVYVVYSLLNTVTEEKIYRYGQEPKPPTPHYTDGMPQAQITASELVTPDKLPHETMS